MPQFPSRESASGIWTLKKQKRAQQGSNWPLRSLGDFLWNYVTALFKTTPTNGAQNNTFLDSSTNNFTITRNGNTTQGSFSPFSQTGWGNYFDGSGDYLSTPSSTVDFSTNQFCMETWVYFSSLTATTSLFGTRSGDSTTTIRWSLLVDASASYKVYFSAYSSSNTLICAIPSDAGLTAGQWYHIAATRDSSNVIRLFVNGIAQSSTVTSGAALANSVTSVNIGMMPGSFGGTGGPLNGYLSNLRLVNGSAVYTSNFTPSTTPLTAISGTSLLTCQANRFLDASSNAFAITRNGDVSVQRFSPFSPSAPYAAGTDGASGYFDGSGDYLSITGASAFAIGTSAFSLEGWCYFNDVNTNGAGFGTAAVVADASTDRGVSLFLTGSGAWRFRIGRSVAGQFEDFLGTTTLVAGQWYNFKIVRTSTGTNDTRVYLNGVQEAIGTSTISLNMQKFSIGYYAPSDTSTASINGYVSGVRFTNTAVSSAIPTAPITAVSGTQLLCNFTNAGIYDSAINNDVETAGNAQVSTTQARFGTTSMYFDGSGDYLLVPASPNLAHGTGNFTLEMWVNTSTTSISNSASRTMWGTSSASYQGQLYLEIGTGKVVFGNTGSTFLKGSSNVADGNWHHIAVSRNGTNCILFVDGRREASGTNSVNYDAQPAYVGAFGPSDGYFNGYLDDLRITKGYARYWYPFTPPAVTLGDYYEPEIIPASDPLFDYTTLLLSGNGTNGAQNNTFLDSSTNNFSITRNGNATQGVFSPYGSLWSNSFNGNGDWLTTNLDATTGQYLAFGSTQDFTIELFFNQVGDSVPSPDASNARNTSLISTTQQDQNFPLTGWDLGINPSSTSIGFSNNNNENSGTGFGATLEVTRNIWHHVAVVRSSGTMTLYLDGAAVATSSAFNNRAITVAASAFLRIGTFRFRGYYNDFNGYISNVRIVKGTAVYSGTTYTVPTAPLTAISGTVLLACQDNRFRDNSSSAYTLSTNGTPSVQRFSPFNPTTPYAAGTDGGSGYFDGSGDWLSAGDQTAFEFGSGEFTISAWVYLTSFASTCTIASKYVGGDIANSEFVLWVTTGGNIGIALDGGGGEDYIASASGAVTLNQWAYIVASKSGTTVRLFLNGTQVASGTSTRTLNTTSTALTIGGIGSGSLLTGYISGLCIQKGIGYSSVTVPTAPISLPTNTSLLLNFTNAGIIDNAEMNNLETVGNAQISTTQSKFGGASMLFDGTGDYLQSPSSPQFSFDGDMTIEAWIYPSVLSGSTAYAICGTHSGANDGKTEFYVYGTGKIAIGKVGVNEIASATGIISTGTWYHVAAVRSGSTTTVYVNGVSVASGTTAVWSTGASPIYVAYFNPSNGATWNGYIDDLRITRGIARYVQPFTPPTQAFQTQ